MYKIPAAGKALLKKKRFFCLFVLTKESNIKIYLYFFVTSFNIDVYNINIMISERFPRFRRRRYRPLTPKDLPMTGSESSWELWLKRTRIVSETEKNKDSCAAIKNWKLHHVLQWTVFIEKVFLQDLVTSYRQFRTHSTIFKYK